MACLQIYRELLSLTTFLRVHSNWKEVSYLSWQNTYPNLKTACHIKLKFFLWTKLLGNLLLAKYLISVAAPLTLLCLPFSLISFEVVVIACKYSAKYNYIICVSGPDGRITADLRLIQIVPLLSLFQWNSLLK